MSRPAERVQFARTAAGGQEASSCASSAQLLLAACCCCCSAPVAEQWPRKPPTEQAQSLPGLVGALLLDVLERPAGSSFSGHSELSSALALGRACVRARARPSESESTRLE